MDPDLQPGLHPSPLRPSHKENLQGTGDLLGKMSGDAWEHIRSLDETENWHERNTVISKTDHQTYTNWAREVVEDIVDGVPKGSTQAPPSGAMPPTTVRSPPIQTTRQTGGDDFKYMNEFSDEDFQGSAAQFDTEYLANIGNANPSHISALTRESLYVKFDPLVGGQQSLFNSAHKSPNVHRGGGVRRTPNPHSNDLMAVNTPPRDTPTQPHDLLTSPSNLVAIDTPQTSYTQTPGSYFKNSHTPSSLATTSQPSPQLNRSRPPASSAPVRELATGTLVEVLKYGEEDMAAVVEQTRQEERVKYEAQVQLLKEELSRKEQAVQRRVDRVQRECQATRNEMKTHISAKQRLESDLEQLKELLKTNETSQEILHSHYDDLRDKVKDIEQQREAAMKDFEGLDKSFADLHQRYLRLKQSSDSQQQSEKVLKSQISRVESSFHQAEEKCRQLQADSTQQMNKFNSMHDSMQKQHAKDVALTKATVRKLELQVESLQRALDEKGREKEGLTQLCDELLAQINTP